MAILWAAAAPAVTVLGVTTVGGNVGLEATTRNAGRLLALAGRGDVPVHRGAAGPLGTPGEPAIHGADGLGGLDLPEPLAAPGPDAIAFLAATLRAAPAGSVEMWCLGPLTNLARLLGAAPDAARRLRRVVAMGGALQEPGNAAGGRAEFNLAHDPAAAADVLGAGLDLTLVPLDATRRVRADRALLGRLAAGGPLARAAGALVGAYFADAAAARSRPLHDPLVPLLARHPGLARIAPRHLAVDADGALGPGPHPVAVALDPDAAALLDRLASGLGA